ncbi:MAG: hypothetical protein KDC95_03975 [Planctomycetes bacterium]|nr:hypothetical protein [Planctomycetota bacterium]
MHRTSLTTLVTLLALAACATANSVEVPVVWPTVTAAMDALAAELERPDEVAAIDGALAILRPIVQPEIWEGDEIVENIDDEDGICFQLENLRDYLHRRRLIGSAWQRPEGNARYDITRDACTVSPRVVSRTGRLHGERDLARFVFRPAAGGWSIASFRAYF